MEPKIRVTKDTDGSFIGRVDEYPDLLATGFTLEELHEAVAEQIAWFDSDLDEQLEAKRNDPEFQARLKDITERNAKALKRLGE